MPPAAKHVFILFSKLHSCFSRPAKQPSLTWTTQVSGSFSCTQSKCNPLRTQECCTCITWTQPLLGTPHQGTCSKYASYLSSCSSKQPEDFWALGRTTSVQTTCQASQSTAYSTRHSLMLPGCGSTQIQKVYSFAPPHLVHVTSLVSISNSSPSHSTILWNMEFNARGIRQTLLHADHHCAVQEIEITRKARNRVCWEISALLQQPKVLLS